MATLTTSLYQAIANSLATWLASQLCDVRVEPRWTESTVDLFDDDFERVIAVALAGPPQTDEYSPTVDSAIPSVPVPGSSTQRIWAWNIRGIRQPLQLDVWTKYDTHRDDVIARLDPALNAGERLTLGIANGPVVRNGVLLALGDGWTGFADVWFDGARLPDTVDINQQSEFRATYLGTTEAVLSIRAQSAQLAVLQLKQRIAESFPIASSVPYETVRANP